MDRISGRLRDIKSILIYFTKVWGSWAFTPYLIVLRANI